MPKQNIMDRLATGEPLLMDGGTGSEIQRRGADVLVQTTVETELRGWSATANIEYADVVREVHQDYLRCGAEILISNNFWTTPSRLTPLDLPYSWQDYVRAGGENALAARDAMNPEAYVSGGIAPPYVHDHLSGEPRSDVAVMGREAYRQEFAGPAKILVDLGVDFLLPEYIGFKDDCIEAVDACAELGVPVFLGVRHIRPGGVMQYGESLRDLVAGLEGRGVDGILLMCTRPAEISEGLEILKDAYDGVLGAYPNAGYNPMAPLGGRGGMQGDILRPDHCPPSVLGETTAEWLEQGVQIIGGCCATGPEHTIAQAAAFKAAPQGVGAPA